MDVLSVIREQYDSFNKAQRRIADFILEHPDICSFSSLRQLAASTKTTEATIISFSKKIGFLGYQNMKSHLQQNVSQLMSPNGISRSAFPETASSDLYAQAMAGEQNALEQTFLLASSDRLDCSLDLVFHARRIYSIAYSSSTFLSAAFTSRFLRLGLDVVDLGGMPSPDIMCYLAQSKPNDLFVVFSYEACGSVPAFVAQELHKQGRRILCFTDSVSNLAAQLADVFLCSTTKSTIFSDSMTAPISLINLMAARFVCHHPNRVFTFKKRLDAVNSCLPDT